MTLWNIMCIHGLLNNTTNLTTYWKIPLKFTLFNPLPIQTQYTCQFEKPLVWLNIVVSIFSLTFLIPFYIFPLTVSAMFLYPSIRKPYIPYYVLNILCHFILNIYPLIWTQMVWYYFPSEALMHLKMIYIIDHKPDGVLHDQTTTHSITPWRFVLDDINVLEKIKNQIYLFLLFKICSKSLVWGYPNDVSRCSISYLNGPSLLQVHVP